MIPFRSVRNFVALLATVPLLFPLNPHASFGDESRIVSPRGASRAVAADEVRPADVVLESGNVLRGRVLDHQGTPVSNAQLTVVRGREEIGRVITSNTGEFQISVPRGGVYLLTAEHSVLLVRAWTESAAPPAALAQVTLIKRPVIARGQNEDDSSEGGGYGKGLMLLAISGALAAAIVLPILLIEELEEDDKSAS